MIRSLFRAAAALFVTLACALPASATTYSTDFTDLWFNPAESGWGVNVIQQGQTMFVTLFVYGVGNVPQWFVASQVEPAPAGSTTQFTGQLFQTSGPYFGATSFDPTAVKSNAVGTITFTFNSATTGTLSYTVNGQAVNKTITRQTWRNDNLSGNYLGGLTATGSSCSGVPNGPILIFQTLNVQHLSNNQVTMNVLFTSNQGQSSQCTFQGGYTQFGRTGSIAGSWACTVNGQSSNAGNFTLSSIDTSTSGFMGHFTGRDQFCSYDGQFGGVRDVPLS